MKRGAKVVWDNHFEDCIRFGFNVEVWIQDEKQETGKIESYSKESFKINDGFYLRANVVVMVS